MQRVFLPSALRRGRMATSPVWRVDNAGRVWQFHTKKRAVAFEAAGGCAHGNGGARGCVDCGGYVVAEARK